MARKTSSDYQRAYRNKMVGQGMIKIEVWVPRPRKSEIQAYAGRLRQAWASPVNGKENAMWTNETLAETLRESDQAQAGDWEIELIQGSHECLLVTLRDCGDLETYVAASGDQVLVSILLWPADSVGDQAAFNAELLRDHKLLPLSTFGITVGPDGKPWYELFGALSTRSTADSVLTEITTLADNTLEVAEAYRPYLAA